MTGPRRPPPWSVVLFVLSVTIGFAGTVSSLVVVTRGAPFDAVWFWPPSLAVACVGGLVMLAAWPGLERFRPLAAGLGAVIMAAALATDVALVLLVGR